MIHAAMRQLAIDQENVARPDHRDIPVDIDHGIDQAFLELLRTRPQRLGEFRPAFMSDGTSFRRLDRDRRAALGTEFSHQRSGITPGHRVELDLAHAAQRQRWRNTFVAPLDAALAGLAARGVRVQALSSDAPSESWLPLLGAARPVAS